MMQKKNKNTFVSFQSDSQSDYHSEEFPITLDAFLKKGIAYRTCDWLYSKIFQPVIDRWESFQRNLTRRKIKRNNPDLYI